MLTQIKLEKTLNPHDVTKFNTMFLRIAFLIKSPNPSALPPLSLTSALMFSIARKSVAAVVYIVMMAKPMRTVV